MSSRWLFEAVLETLSPLHIGDGNWDEGLVKEDVEGRNLLRVATASDHTAYIPGTTLKGRLRSWLDSGGGAPAFNDLFGTRMPEDGGDDPNAVGGLLEFADALWTSSAVAGGPGWNGERKTCMATNVTIDRRTGTPAHQKLFSVEYVPGGTMFTIKLYARNLSEPQARLIAEVLGACNGDEASPKLGASTTDGWGRFKLGQINVKRLNGEALRNWASDPNRPVEQAMVEVAKESLPAPDRPALPGRRPTLDLNIRILFSGPFLSNDVSRAQQQPAKKKWERTTQAPNFVPLMDDQGQPMLPVSSLRGALRSRAEKIWRTLNPEAPYYTVSPRAAADLDLLQVREAADVSNLDPPSLLFGAPGWGTPLAFGPIEAERPGQLLDQDMVAIDRFTGGAADRAKFRSQFFYKPVMRTTLRVNAGALGIGGDRLSAEAWKLLAFALQDLADGFITLGYGAAKGYGACTAEVTLADPQEVALAPESLRVIFQQGLRPHPLPAPSAAPAAAPPLTVDGCGNGKFQPNYNFLRVEGSPQRCLTASQFDLGKIGEYGHDRIAGYTGRMECFITAETPFFIGSSQRPDDEQRPGQPKRLNGFRLPGESGPNYPAIPATSLRGMVSSVYEAVTKSSLRVLIDKSYSYRKSSDQALTAIGMMIRRGGKWYMKPLCLPIQPSQIQKYRPYFPKPILRVFNGDENTVFKLEFEQQFPTWRPGEPQIVMCRIPSLEWDNFSHPSIRRKGPAIIHQTARGDAAEVPCLVRTLGCSGEGRQVPRGVGTKAGKKHELLIPFPDHDGFQVENAGPADGRVIEVPPVVVERFERLADEVTEEWDGPNSGKDPRPYEPRPTRPNRSLERTLRIRPGDIVYFDFDATKAKVSEIAFSAIWRGEVKNVQGGAASTHDFFAQIDKDYLPLTEKRLQGRDAALTPAELLFGFVEDRKEETDPQQRTLAFKGRIRFGAGELVDPPEDASAVLMQEVPLKALSSPKPPCPALYFWKDENEWIAKAALKCGYQHNKNLPRGRKVYLHHRPEGEPWRSGPAAVSELFSQQVAVQPIRPGTQFRFEICFENLMEAELAMLCCVLRPSEAFRHKLGMGKPIGLGTVRVDIGRIDVLSPYPTDRYCLEYLGDPARERFLLPMPESDLPMVDARAKVPQSLLTVGSRAGTAVSYPLVTGLRPGTADVELELYRWFVANDRVGHNTLPPLEGANHLPVLDKQEQV